MSVLSNLHGRTRHERRSEQVLLLIVFIADCSEYCCHPFILAFVFFYQPHGWMVDGECKCKVHLARKLDRIKGNSIHILPSLIVHLCLLFDGFYFESCCTSVFPHLIYLGWPGSQYYAGRKQPTGVSTTVSRARSAWPKSCPEA